ncbi:MAG TPA: hypothetical protein VGF97_03560 [Rhizomicrobium sp.]
MRQLVSGDIDPNTPTMRSLDTREISEFVDKLCDRGDHSLRTRLTAFAAERGVVIK